MNQESGRAGLSQLTRAVEALALAEYRVGLRPDTASLFHFPLVGRVMARRLFVR